MVIGYPYTYGDVLSEQEAQTNFKNCSPWILGLCVITVTFTSFPAFGISKRLMESGQDLPSIEASKVSNGGNNLIMGVMYLSIFMFGVSIGSLVVSTQAEAEVLEPVSQEFDEPNGDLPVALQVVIIIGKIVLFKYLRGLDCLEGCGRICADPVEWEGCVYPGISYLE